MSKTGYLYLKCVDYYVQNGQKGVACGENGLATLVKLKVDSLKPEMSRLFCVENGLVKLKVCRKWVVLLIYI